MWGSKPPRQNEANFQIRIDNLKNHPYNCAYLHNQNPNYPIAMEALMTGDPISAQDAMKYGLVNRVVPKDKLMQTAETLANRLLENAPLAVRAVKEAAYRGIRMHLSEGLSLETMMINNVFQSEDAKEGPRAFAEKRKPVFRAR